METAHRYRASAEEAARGASPRYEEFALGVAEDRDVLAFLSTLPELKRQPNLLFAAVKYLAGVPPDYGAFHDFVIGHMDELRQLMRTRSTQTNEPGRCAVLLPLLASLRQPIALLEVGAAAGLCLLCDRYGYDYEGHRVGPADAPVVFPCNPIGSVPLPERVPRVVWRCGVDLDPLDVTDPDTAAWLTLSCGQITPIVRSGYKRPSASRRWMPHRCLLGTSSERSSRSRRAPRPTPPWCFSIRP